MACITVICALRHRRWRFGFIARPPGFAEHARHPLKTIYKCFIYIGVTVNIIGVIINFNKK